MPINAAKLDFTGEAIDVLPGVNESIARSPETGFANLLGRVMSVAMTIAAIMLLIYFIWGALEWLSANGDKSKVEKARSRIANAITGIVVLSATAAVIMIVQSFLGISVLNFTGLWNPNYTNGGVTGGTGGGDGGTGGGSGNSCTPSTTLENDGATGNYCTLNGVVSPAMVRCNYPDDHLNYNHYDPCYCLDGGTPRPGIDFDTC